MREGKKRMREGEGRVACVADGNFPVNSNRKISSCSAVTRK